MRLRSVHVAILCLLSAALVHCAGAENDSEGLAEKQYQKALELREKDNASGKQLAQAASLLKAAAGLQIVGPNSEPVTNKLMPEQKYFEIDPGVFVDDQGLPFNPQVAFSLLLYAASLGLPAAQRELGLALAIGLRPPRKNTPQQTAFEFGSPSWPEALLHLYSAASNEDRFAQLVLGYRHFEGLGVPKNCTTAALYYAPVAESVVEDARQPQGLPKVDLVPLNSEAPRWPRLKADHERLHYQWFADMGYVDAQRMVGRLLSLGGEQNAQEALKYFRKAAEANDGEAKAFLGHFYANGVGVEANNETALSLFREGAKLGSASANFGLGFMYLYGYGLPQNYNHALKFLSKSAEKGHAEAMFHMGTMHLNGWGIPQSLSQAQNFYALAANIGHPAAQYNLAMTLLEQEETCRMGVARLKTVAERGPWTHMLRQAADHLEDGRQDLALMLYLKLGEAGFEVAQVNAAWMISNNHGLSPFVDANEFNATDNTAAHAAKAGIRSNQRASQQGNVPAMLAVGDTYYYGRGVLRDLGKAFQLYLAAANMGHSAQAFYNVGYMYQFGLGATPDFALAKRNFDKSAQTHPHAYVPAKLALLRLFAHRWWLKSGPAWLQSVVGSGTENEVIQPPGRFLPKLAIDLPALPNPLSLDFAVTAELALGMVKKLDYEAWEAYMISALGMGLLAILLRRRQLRRPWQEDLANAQLHRAQMTNPAHQPHNPTHQPGPAPHQSSGILQAAGPVHEANESSQNVRAADEALPLSNTIPSSSNVGQVGEGTGGALQGGDLPDIPQHGQGPSSSNGNQNDGNTIIEQSDENGHRQDTTMSDFVDPSSFTRETRTENPEQRQQVNASRDQT